ncbi:cytochrome P450 [Kutzneria viridogrisea]|uniref:Pentalenolactone synthase n=1 Tax=Kutzneria viridogrisea TaxID=47990 RepID=A0ABR6BU71_9PSEU|nr:pentalenolactone synthase [Kutzneria viridogrisea]
MTDLPSLPFATTGVLDLPPELLRLQDNAPISRVRTMAGDEAWLVSRYEDVKALFADERLGRSHPRPEKAAKVTNSAILGGASGDYDTEDHDHAAMRAMLVPAFSPRRMRAMRPLIERLVEDLLDAMQAKQPPVDLHTELAEPLPVLVICELLGVPYADRAEFRALSDAAADTVNAQSSATAWQGLVEYMAGLIAGKRTQPGDDLLSDLIAAHGDKVADGDLAALGAGLLFAGHETTLVRIDFGTVLLLSNPDQREAALRGDSELAATVEEVLRRSSNGVGGLPRYAREDIQVGDVTIAAGEAVLLSIGGANHDAQAFPEPTRFDAGRASNQHLAFGHGARYCIGASLARIELQVVFAALLRRFPTLRLAVPVDQLELRTGRLGGGLVSVPVAW